MPPAVASCRRHRRRQAHRSATWARNGWLGPLSATGTTSIQRCGCTTSHRSRQGIGIGGQGSGINALILTRSPIPEIIGILILANRNVANLKSLSGAAFDKAYIANEVTYHQQVLDAVDKVLIPSAKNEELKALLVKVRPAFLAHLEHAKKVQASLH